MKNKSLGYEIRIGNECDYFDTTQSLPMICKIVDIFHDGCDVVYEFREMNSDGIGSTIFPDKLKPREAFDLDEYSAEPVTEEDYLNVTWVNDPEIKIFDCTECGTPFMTTIHYQICDGCLGDASLD